MTSTEGTTFIHEHCSNCRKMNCVIKADNITSCALIYCAAGCNARFHSCKETDHRQVCQKEKIPCINRLYGCPLEMLREKVTDHLPKCPASVIMCPREWNRWPMHSQDEGWKAPLPFKNPHVKCGQLDVAFAMRDQKVLMDSFKTPLRTRKILRNPLTQRYPPVPIHSTATAPTDIDSLISEVSEVSDDDCGTPWDRDQYPPGLQSAVCNQVPQVNYSKYSDRSAEAIRVDPDQPAPEGARSSSLIRLYSASKQATESLTKALDYVTGKQGLKRLSDLAKREEEKAKRLAEQKKKLLQDAANVTNKLQESHINRNNGTHNQTEDDLDIYINEKKLFEVLGLDLTMQFISPYIPKPVKMFTFQCSQEFRRDEYPWHIRNYHTDIQCNLNGWFEQRCPLSYLGCTFAFQRFKPKKPDGCIVYSSVLNSLGFSKEEELETSKSQLEDDIQTEIGRSHLREATPEIHTSFKCDSAVKVVPRYKSVSRESSPNKSLTPGDNMTETCIFTSLPFEVLQNVARFLDSYSISHLSITCKMLQSVCCSLLDERGVVSLVWKKTGGQVAPGQCVWNVVYKKWHFSPGFTPIEDWGLCDNSTSAVTEHLKVCPYNQEEDRTIHTEPVQVFFDTPINSPTGLPPCGTLDEMDDGNLSTNNV